MKNKLVNQKNVPSFFLDNPDQLRSVSEEIRKFNPSTIEGYSTAVYTLAQYFRETKQNIPGLKQVFTTAENLEDYQRTLIEDVLAPASDLYGCGEIMGIAARPVNDERYKARDAFERAYAISADKELPAATESLARAMKAKDGTVGRANAWILSLRPKPPPPAKAAAAVEKKVIE